ncbi:hypothetical protein DAEQUDRAFT_273133 [Daedalea quercina L-15889]|uniref:RING-type domain-containing protein n=1 Tax=Daedalea quercina L-15889 TaxID=1314783 RepID=A0A165QDG7_9APHY|nr:hypothetical protein DAEQUDRAFT_273133 [Daedalea quercina L-15889]
MPTCIICLEVLKDPAALPCGHVFCYSCIVKIVRSITPYTTHHFCPSCRHPYTVCEFLSYPAFRAQAFIVVIHLAHVDPNLVPHHLQPHVSPAVRKLHLEYNTPSMQAASAESPAAECDRLRAEIASLKACSIVWRKRAAVHAAATLGVIGLARLARDTAVKMKSERDDMETKYLALQEKYEESQRTAVNQAQPRLPKFCDVFCATPLPISTGFSRTTSRTSFRMPSPSPSTDSYCSDCLECSQGSVKRKRDECDEADAPLKRTRSNSSSSSPSPHFAKLALAESFERKPFICPGHRAH